MLKEIENIDFVQGVNFDFVDFLENNGTRYLLNFDGSCQNVCNFRELRKIGVAGRHRGLSTIYIMHNLFHNSILGGDIEPHNTHIVLFQSPRDVLQVVRLSVKLGLFLSLVDWHKDATYVPFCHLLIDLPPGTDDGLRYCTNSGEKPSNFYIPEQLKYLRLLDDDHTISLFILQAFRKFSQCKKHFLQNSPREFIRFLSECIVNLLHGNLQDLEKRKVLEYRKQLHSLSLV